MNPKLTEEMRAALKRQPGRPVRLEDEETQKVYVIIDDETHKRAMEALRQQEDVAAIQAGIDDMEAERVVPFEEVDARVRNKLGLPPRS
jgi:predicted transcriptional regulator